MTPEELIEDLRKDAPKAGQKRHLGGLSLYNVVRAARKGGFSLRGTVLTTADGDRLLVGDINGLGGACDCCSYPEDHVVLLEVPAFPVD